MTNAKAAPEQTLRRSSPKRMIINDSPSASPGLSDCARQISLNRKSSVTVAKKLLDEHIGASAGRDMPGLQIGRPT